jgi:poly(3-hydroxyalkanoate) synthetase
VNPDERHAEKSFEHYMNEGILEALDVVEKATGEAPGQRCRLLLSAAPCFP